MSVTASQSMVRRIALPPPRRLDGLDPFGHQGARWATADLASIDSRIEGDSGKHLGVEVWRKRVQLGQRQIFQGAALFQAIAYHAPDDLVCLAEGKPLCGQIICHVGGSAEAFQ